MERRVQQDCGRTLDGLRNRFLNGRICQESNRIASGNAKLTVSIRIFANAARGAVLSRNLFIGRPPPSRRPLPVSNAPTLLGYRLDHEISAKWRQACTLMSAHPKL